MGVDARNIENISQLHNRGAELINFYFALAPVEFSEGDHLTVNLNFEDRSV
jgi:hypothetical protein